MGAPKPSFALFRSFQLPLERVLIGVGSVFGGSWEASDGYWESKIASWGHLGPSQDFSPLPKVVFEGSLERKHHYQVPLGSVLDGVGSVLGDLGGSRRLLGIPKLHRGAVLDLLISILATQWSRFGSGTSLNGHF